jgi:hypothetical protein
VPPENINRKDDKPTDRTFSLFVQPETQVEWNVQTPPLLLRETIGGNEGIHAWLRAVSVTCPLSPSAAYILRKAGSVDEAISSVPGPQSMVSV